MTVNPDRQPASLVKHSAAATVLVGGYVPLAVQARMRAAARAAGTTIASLVREFAYSVAGQAPPRPPTVGAAQKLMVRLCEPARLALREAATQRRSTPAAWAAAMLEAQLLHRARWSAGEEAALQSIYVELQRIGDAMADREAAAAVERAMNRVAAAVSGNYAYWGVPTDPAPARARGAAAQEDAATRAQMGRGRRRPKYAAAPRAAPAPGPASAPR